MERAAALEIAKTNYTARRAALVANGFNEINESEFGYRHGWFIVEGHSFNNEDITGHAYDANQGGWAWV